MTDLIDRNAALAALRDALAQDPHSKLFGVRRHYIEAILAIPTVQPDPLGAHERVIRDLTMLVNQLCKYAPDDKVAAAFDYLHRKNLASPLREADPTDADLDRAALARPKVAALVGALRTIAMGRCDFASAIYIASAALAALKEVE